MAHDHQHNTKNIKTAFFLNFFFTIIEFIGGYLTNSTAILADAVHDLGDTVALGQAWYFEKISHRKTTHRYTYGFKRFALLGAMISTLLLLLSSIYVLSQAIPRLMAPEDIHAEGMLLLSIIGIAINGFAIFKLSKNSGINSKAVALHLLEDILGWVAVFVVSIVMMFVYLPILDPILAILITLYILRNVLNNIKEMLPVFLQAVPDEEDLKSITTALKSLEAVENLHHIHLWSLDGEHTIFSAHIVLNRALNTKEYDAFKSEIREILRDFDHTTIEIEFPHEVCRMDLLESRH